MIRINGKRGGFTLIELLVVVGMIAVILGAITTSVSSAQTRARINKAKTEVKVISQAILSYERISNQQELPTMDKAEAGKDTLGFILGEGGNAGAKGEQADKVSVLLMAALRSDGRMLDPWGHPYLVTIRKTSDHVKIGTATGSLQSGYDLPNMFRLAPEERNLWTD